LLNGKTENIQIHEYLALKFNYETAVGTREWWATGEEQISCWCGKCPYCSCTQSGCCNRLDKETSGVMVAAKTKHGFGEIRSQFASEHSLETGGTEKYYFALCHGNVQLPKQTDEKSPSWKHGLTDGRGRVEVVMWSDKDARCSKAWDAGDGPPPDMHKSSAQHALTFYEPVAWFTGPKEETFTLVRVQIITGRTHQIRFHLAEVGHPLAGDPTYGAPHSDRKWCGRVFLHSYQTKFREPFTLRWFEATSPLPPDLGQILVGLQLDLVKEGLQEPYLARRDHPSLHKVMKQYDPMKPLLFSHDPPVSAEAVAAAKNQMKFAAALNQPAAQDVQGKWAGKDAWNQGGSANAGGTGGGSAPSASHQNGSGADAGSWQNGGSSWSGEWESKDSWKQNNWKSSGWKKDNWQGGDWKNESNGQKGQGKASKAQSQSNANEDDDDAWGGWSAPAQSNQTEQKEQQQQQQQMPPQGQATTAAAGEPALKRPRIEVPANTAHLTPSTPPKALAFLSGQLQKPPGFRRMESRSQPGIFYYFNETTNETRVEPPPPWEKKESRSQPGVFYYWNSVTCETSVVKPLV
jgi:23S rRNA-/tRNA-specific pseudouridylate synthase